MRKLTLIAIILIVAGVLAFFIGPVAIEANSVIQQFKGFKVTELGPGESMTIPFYGKTGGVIYNDSLVVNGSNKTNLPLAFQVKSGNATAPELSSGYLLLPISSVTGFANVTLTDNYTSNALIYYTLVQVRSSAFYEIAASIYGGIIVAIVGVIVLAYGAIRRRKPQNQ
ncbi:hypothetical protein HS7_02600 [Sulfolobales archaeon HS-7]|nr:hypothetical protein HS7_02600 [Sulfolobales archaeon HS-7]